MNSLDDHLGKARHNLAFLGSLDLSGDDFADWGIVVLFYAALHVVRAALHARETDHGTSHPQTQRGVEEVFPENAARSYERLYSRSRLVRYDELRASLADFQRLRDSDFSTVVRAASYFLPQRI